VAATSGESLPGWCVRLVSELDESGARAAKLSKRLSPDQINWKPSAHEWSIGQCLDRFLRSNEQVRALAHRAASYDVNRIRFKNPYLPLIRFTVGTGLLIMPAHERRHLLQAERIKTSAGFPNR